MVLLSWPFSQLPQYTQNFASSMTAVVTHLTPTVAKNDLFGVSKAVAVASQSNLARYFIRSHVGYQDKAALLPHSYH